MRLALELPDTPEGGLRVQACMAAKRVLAEHGVTLSRLALLASESGRSQQERAAYQLASDVAVRVLTDAGTPAEQIERARFALIS
ncbi:hypothetical protein [Xanthomonas phaseoli]|uniref:hypothetical protein n=1 Tax=Xanthomonas phaseoli TaxID=1985254 RepID=UPI00036771CB|nr:hypothetical protein [Xanthomonas phaseoli]